MSSASLPRIGIYDPDPAPASPAGGCGLWPAGYDAVVSAAGGTPVPLRLPHGCTWDDVLGGLSGVVFAGGAAAGPRRQADGERLCAWCRHLGLPVLAVDHGLHALNAAFGGTAYLDLGRELPEALQHRGQPEPGDRHAILVQAGTRLAACYGAGEAVVNSAHRRAVCQVARGFRISARALDGVVEAVEPEEGGWFALGVQWQPASATASGLDIQLFRGLIEACGARRQEGPPAPQLVAA